MKFYLFNGGMLKVEDEVAVADVVDPNLDLTRVTRLQFYAQRVKDCSKKTASGAKVAYQVTKKKAVDIKDAVKK